MSKSLKRRAVICSRCESRILTVQNRHYRDGRVTCLECMNALDLALENPDAPAQVLAAAPETRPTVNLSPFPRVKREPRATLADFTRPRLQEDDLE